MFTVLLIPLTCWVCALIAIPRRPRTGNEVAELVYARLLGRQQLLVCVASVVSGVALFALVIAASQQESADLRDVRQLHGICASQRDATATCATVMPGDQWPGPIRGGR